MENAQRIIGLVLKAIALGMAVVSIMLGFLPQTAYMSTQVALLSIGPWPWLPFRTRAEQKTGDRRLAHAPYTAGILLLA